MNEHALDAMRYMAWALKEPDHQEQGESATFYLTFVSSTHMGVYALYWNTNAKLPYGKKFYICTKIEFPRTGGYQ